MKKLFILIAFIGVLNFSYADVQPNIEPVNTEHVNLESEVRFIKGERLRDSESINQSFQDSTEMPDEGIIEAIFDVIDYLFTNPMPEYGSLWSWVLYVINIILYIISILGALGIIAWIPKWWPTVNPTRLKGILSTIAFILEKASILIKKYKDLPADRKKGGGVHEK